MGKIALSSKAPPPYADDSSSAVSDRAETASLADAVSLHQYEADLPAYTDDDVQVGDPVDRDGSMPDYRPAINGTNAQRHVASHSTPDGRNYTSTYNTFATSDPIFSTDADHLRDFIIYQAGRPPRIQIRLKGHHTEIRTQNNKKEERNTITDFDLLLDSERLFSPKLRPDIWPTLAVLDDTKKAYRGSIFKTHAKSTNTDPEGSLSASGIEPLRNWCYIYTSRVSQSRLPYTFTMRRTVSEWNTDFLKAQLDSMMRATNYRGNVETNLSILNETFTVHSPHWMNRARHNHYIWWACIVLQLWIITWPILFFCTGRFEVVTVDWPYQKKDIQGQPIYASYSENRWLETWGSTMVDAAFARRHGCLTKDDLTRVMKLQLATQQNAGQSAERRSSGSDVVDTAVGIFAGITGVMNDTRTSQGWGVDQGTPRTSRMSWKNLRSAKTGGIRL